MSKLFLTLILITLLYLSAEGHLDNSFQAPNDANCPSGYFYNSTNTTCDFCATVIDYCTDCSDSTTCTQCSNSYYTYLQAGKCIVNCSEGYYINPNKSSDQLCLSCMQNCKTCVNSSSCTECQYPYVWNDTKQLCLTPGGCGDGCFYNSSGMCQECYEVLYNCASCLNNSYCISCITAFHMIYSNGQCECRPGTYSTFNYPTVSACGICTPFCLSCDNNTSCNECEPQFSWNQTSQICTKSIIDLTSQVNTDSQGNFWWVNLNTTGIPQLYQLKLTQSNIPGAFYWRKNAIYPTVYVSTNCSSKCQGFDLQNPPSENNYCFSTPANTEAWTLLTDDAITEPQCYIQFYIPNNYQLNQLYNFYYFPQTTLELSYNVFDYAWAPSLFRYYIYVFPGLEEGTGHSSSIITLQINSSFYEEIYLGTNDTSSNCDYILPSASQHCSGVQIQKNNGVDTISFTTQNYNSIIYFAISNAANTGYSSFSVETQLICNTGYYQPNDQQNKCLIIANQNTSWDLTNLSTQWQNTEEKYWLIPILNNTINQNNIYTLKLQSNESIGTFYLFLNEQQQDIQSIYISTNCTTSCASDNYTENPFSTQYCYNALLGTNQMFSLNTDENIGQCNFYFTIPATNNITSTVQFAYFPQLTLISSENYFNIPIPWTFPTEQFFTYKIPQTIENDVNVITLNKLNRAVISDLYFSTNDTYYSSIGCNSTFPTEGSQYQYCNITATNYSIGNMDYYKFTFALNNESSHVVLGFLTHQNGSYNSFDFSNSSSPPQNTTCLPGQYYNSTQSKCIQCSQIIPNCELCSNNSICTKCQTGFYLPSCTSQQPIYNWNLTGLSTYWQDGPEVYWNFELNYTSNMTNIYSLLLNSNEAIQQTPGTIYIYYDINYVLHNVYISTNCSTIETCYNQTNIPSENNYCWVAGTQSVWSMNTQNTEGQCYFYLSIPELTETPQVNFAFFPQLTLSGRQNYTNLPVPWVFQTEQFFAYKFPNDYAYKNAQNGVHTIVLSGMNSYIVNQIYLGTNDPRYNSTCSTNFPDGLVNCGIESTHYTTDNTTYLLYTFSIDSANSSIRLGFMENSYDAIYYLDFNSNFTFSCNENYILNNNTCVKQYTQCSEGYYYNTTLLECVLCSSGISYCVKCSQTGGQCTQCSTGQGGEITLTDGKCFVTCDSGKYPNPEIILTNLCLPCMTHCVQCNSASTCEECYEPTYKWNDVTNNCENNCKEGQYFDEEKQSCLNCEVQYCTVCYGSGNQCSECTDGYQPLQNNQNGYACQKIETKPKSSQKINIGIFALLVLLLVIFFIEI